MKIFKRVSTMLILSAALISSPKSIAADAASTLAALRIANSITGGFMPTSDPAFAQIVSAAQAGDLYAAAQLAANSKYAASYLYRRLALQMQNASLDPSGGTDNDSTAYIIAHFVGGGGMPASISSLWSENATYEVNVAGAATHAADLTAIQLAAVNWTTDLVRSAGQNAQDGNGNAIAIPIKHVGGYLTLSDRANDNSYAMYGALAGTNLRMIEGVWETSMGLALLDVGSTSARAQDVPRFVPEYDPNFFSGQGQPACIACHGGGMSSVNHGYATVADIFDYDPTNGLVYIAAPTTNTRKSLGSDPKKRAANLACALSKTPTAVCNPDSVGVDPNQGWDLVPTWGTTGVLSKMGWSGSTSGQGLNSLGINLGKARLVYEFLVKRVVGEICPMGAFTQSDVSSIAAAANPNAQPAGSDDIRTIVAKVASHPSCQ